MPFVRSMLLRLRAVFAWWFADIRRRSFLGKIVSLSIGLFVFLCICSFGLAAAGGVGQAVGLVPTSTPKPLPTHTPVPTATVPPTPTRTPAPTNTPGPTRTPAPTATPTTPPTPTQPPEPVRVSGTGKVVTEQLTPPSGVNRITFTHAGRRNFIVHGYWADGKEDFFVNAIGAYQGQRLLVGDTPLYLEVDADGAWTVEIEPIVHTGTTAQAIEGAGDTVSDIFDPAGARPVPYHLTHTGKRNFIVHLYCAGGDDSVANEIGAVAGDVVVRFDTGPCVWEVQADGAWTIAPK